MAAVLAISRTCPQFRRMIGQSDRLELLHQMPGNPAKSFRDSESNERRNRLGLGPSARHERNAPPDIRIGIAGDSY